MLYWEKGKQTISPNLLSKQDSKKRWAELHSYWTRVACCGLFIWKVLGILYRHQSNCAFRSWCTPLPNGKEVHKTNTDKMGATLPRIQFWGKDQRVAKTKWLSTYQDWSAMKVLSREPNRWLIPRWEGIYTIAHTYTMVCRLCKLYCVWTDVDWVELLSTEEVPVWC